MIELTGLRIGLVGPLPPPSGGMANQTRQLFRFLESEGAQVELVRVNSPYHPGWMGGVRWARALARLLPYVQQLRQVAKRVQVFHIMANSGWAWHLFASPAVWAAHIQGIPSIINYRGGNAEAFFSGSFRLLRPTLRVASSIVVPSAYLEGTFVKRGFPVAVVPNVVDLKRFAPSSPPLSSGRWKGEAPQILVARNLEKLYDIPTALRAFRIVRKAIPGAGLRVAGTGSDEKKLVALSAELGLGEAVSFLGRVDNEAMPELYREADLVVNPSLVDNMPISILEALASGVAVVSTDVGGVPFLVKHGRTAILVPPGQPEAMAKSVLTLLGDHDLRGRIQGEGLELAKQYDWAQVRESWKGVYAAVLNGSRPLGKPGDDSPELAYPGR